MAIETVEAMVPIRMGPHDRRQIGARFALLLDSLSSHWTDAEPLRLTVVGMAEELEALSALAAPRPNLDVRVIGERMLVDDPGVLRLGGWFKQTFIKLAFAGICEADAYLYLDDDVVCVRSLGRADLVRDGVALSCWEPKASHPGWWRGARDLLGRSEPGASQGLSVTPNVLTCAIARAIPDAIVAAPGQTVIEAMLAATGGDSSACWVEQTLYTELGEMTGQLQRLHRPPAGRRFHSNADVWSEGDLAAWDPGAALAREAFTPFVVVNAKLGADPAMIREKLAAFP
jgi:Family of unknown function (DUF6492)